MLNTHRYENKMLEIINLPCSALSIECCIFQESYLFRFYIWNKQRTLGILTSFCILQSDWSISILVHIIKSIGRFYLSLIKPVVQRIFIQIRLCDISYRLISHFHIFISFVILRTVPAIGRRITLSRHHGPPCKQLQTHKNNKSDRNQS